MQQQPNSRNTRQKKIDCGLLSRSFLLLRPPPPPALLLHVYDERAST